MTRKILQIGSSVGVTIPKSILKKLNLTVGDEVDVEADDGRVLIQKRRDQDKPINPKLLEWTDNFIETYRDALEELSDK